MAKKNFAAYVAAAKRVNYLVVLMVAVVLNLLMTGCQDDYRAERESFQTQDYDPTAQPTVPGLEFNFNYDIINRGWKVETPWTITEKVTGLKENGTSSDWVSHKEDRYAVVEALRNVSLKYTQENTSASQTFTSLVTSSASRKEYKDSVRYSAMIEDGNIAYLDCVNNRIEREVRDTLRKLPYIRTKSARVKAINTLPGTTKYQTRAAYVSDSICREVVWELNKEVVGNGIVADKTFSVELRDTFKVLLLSEDEIDGAKAINKNREIIDATTERCSFDEVFTMKSGEQHTNTKNIILNRNIITIDEYLKTVSSFGYAWQRDNTLAKGNASQVRTEGDWTVNGRTDKFSALITNNAEPITTDYGFYHESAEYKDSYVKVEFEFITPVMKENNSHVESVVSSDANYDQARLHNTIDTEYYGYNQQAQESVLLQKPAVKILKEGFESLDGTRVVFNDSIVWTPVYRIEYSDGNIIRTPARCSDDRDLAPETNWESIEDNENQTTGNAFVGSVSNRREMSRTVNGFEFRWERETRPISSTAQLTGSKQENRWRSTEPVRMTVSYRGKSVTYTDLTINTANKANVVGGNTVGEYRVYNYTDNLTYTFGNNSKVVAAPGTIKVLAEAVASEGWENSSAKQVYSDDRVDWSLNWLIKYTTGREERISFATFDGRSLTPKSSWNNIEKNTNHSTGNPTATVVSSNAASKNVDGAVFSWTRETRSIKSVATLDASKQTNEWEAVDPFACSVTYKGKTYTFTKASVNVSNTDAVNGGSEVNDYKVYNYTATLKYAVGDNTKQSAAPGIIRVAVEKKPQEPTFFPEPWGEIVSAVQTVANNELHDSYDYTWSLRFKNGVVLPVVVRKGASKPEWHFEYAEKTNVTTYNGGTYDSGSRTWVNTTAVDTPNHMIWERDGIQRANKSYSTARECKWDESHTLNGRPSVQTSRYTLTIKNGVLSATDSYTGTFMGSWSSYVGD